jgi:hypothetical protein
MVSVTGWLGLRTRAAGGVTGSEHSVQHVLEYLGLFMCVYFKQGCVLLNLFRQPIPPTQLEYQVDDVIGETLTNNGSGIADCERIGRYVFDDHGTGTNHRAITDLHTANYNIAVPNPYVIANLHYFT